jgi:hypothetical protein
LIALFRVDRGWSEQNVLPLLTWRRDILGAMAAWSGFLWSARLYGPLLAAIKEDFLLTAQHYKGLGQFASQYAALLTFAALESSELFKTRELAFATSQLPPDGLMRCVASLSETLDGSAEKRAEYWRHRIAPYFQGVWPKSVEVMTSPVASSLARLCMKAGEAFPEAISELSPWLSKAASGAMLRCTSFKPQAWPDGFLNHLWYFWMRF